MADLMISYAREDAEFVHGLETALASRGLSTWIDSADLEPSAPVRQEIFNAIAEASAVVVVLTPDWAASTYCRQECDHRDESVSIRHVRFLEVSAQFRRCIVDGCAASLAGS